MIRDAVLRISCPDEICRILGGLTILERQLFLLARAGAERIVVAGLKSPGAPPRLPSGVKIIWNEDLENPPSNTKTPHLEVSGRHLFRQEILKKIFSADSLTDSFHDAFGVEAARIIAPKRALMENRPPRVLNLADCLSLEQTPDAKQRASWLLDTARKNTDGLMARLFDRRISLFLTRRLLNSSITPDDITYISAAIGLIGALELLNPDRTHGIVGALLVWLHSVIDGCDGEIARLKFQESTRGAMLDFWSDNVVHFFLFACLTLRMEKVSSFIPVLGILACLGSVGSACLLSPGNRYHWSPKKKGRLGSVAALLAQRDFIYILVLAAAADRLIWFLYAAGAGAPIYFLILIYIRFWFSKINAPSSQNIPSDIPSLL